MRATQRLCLVLLSAVLAGLFWVPPAHLSQQGTRQTRRAHRALSQRPGRAVGWERQALRAEREVLLPRGAVRQPDSGSDLPAVPPAPAGPNRPLLLACGQVLADPAQDFASPPLWVLLRRLLI
jgi:hypothetical protein